MCLFFRMIYWIRKEEKSYSKKNPILNSCEWQNIHGHNSRKITTPNYFGYHKKKYKTCVNIATTKHQKAQCYLSHDCKEISKDEIGSWATEPNTEMMKKTEQQQRHIWNLKRWKDEMKCGKLKFFLFVFLLPIRTPFIFDMISWGQTDDIKISDHHHHTYTCTPYQNYYQILLSYIRWWVGGKKKKSFEMRHR